jgi:hypothetical protein
LAKHIHGQNVEVCARSQRKRHAVRGRSRAHTMRNANGTCDHASCQRSCQRVRHTATPPQMACGRTLSNVPWRNVTLTHSLARTHSAHTNAHPAGAMRPWAGAHARTPPTRSHTALLGEAYKPHLHNLHAMPCPLSRPLAPSLPLSPFVVTPISRREGRGPLFPIGRVEARTINLTVARARGMR